jgi:hypothetical protein
MLPVARANLQRAGLADAIELQAQDILEARPFADSGFIVTNPPYGVRMDEQDALAELYPQLGDWLKAHFAGWTAHFFTGDLRLSDMIHLSVKRRTPLFNGSLPCRLFAIPMVAGSARRENRPVQITQSMTETTPSNQQRHSDEQGPALPGLVHLSLHYMTGCLFAGMSTLPACSL